MSAPLASFVRTLARRHLNRPAERQLREAELPGPAVPVPPRTSTLRPNDVNPAATRLLHDYCRHHGVELDSNGVPL